jgi:hypothetical protein
MSKKKHPLFLCPIEFNKTTKIEIKFTDLQLFMNNLSLYFHCFFVNL